jgi:hypothetical protein
MIFTEKEQKWIKDNSAVINSGDFKKIMEAISSIPRDSDISTKKLRVTLAYLTFGPKGFIAIGYTKNPNIVIKGALINRTSLKAEGSPLLPSMFGKVKIHLYRIENNKIANQEVVTVPATRGEFLDLISKGGWNLVVLERKEYTEAVEAAFNQQIYGVAIDFNPVVTEYEFHVTENNILTESREKAIPLLKEKLDNWFAPSFGSIGRELVDYLMENINWGTN